MPTLSHSLKMTLQPTETTCGPSCLHALYGFWGLNISLDAVLKTVEELPAGGTLGVNLGIDALNRGFEAKIYTHNLQIFDFSWFPLSKKEQVEKLSLLAASEKPEKNRLASQYYIDFLSRGGQVLFEDLSTEFLKTILKTGPALCGLSATYLYKSKREMDDSGKYDDVLGNPQGHFVILSGISKDGKRVEILDPLERNPGLLGSKYEVSTQHFMGSVLVGVLTYDANFLVIQRRNE